MGKLQKLLKTKEKPAYAERPHPALVSFSTKFDKNQPYAPQIKNWLNEFHAEKPELRDFKHYALNGTERVTPRHIDEHLPEHRKTFDKIDFMQQNACYKNAIMAAPAFGDDPRLKYGEGIYVDHMTSRPIQHAWLELGGKVYDPTWHHVFDRKAHNNGATYYGVDYDPDVAAGTMLGEGTTRPVALGPKRSKKQRMIEDANY